MSVFEGSARKGFYTREVQSSRSRIVTKITCLAKSFVTKFVLDKEDDVLKESYKFHNNKRNIVVSKGK